VDDVRRLPARVDCDGDDPGAVCGNGADKLRAKAQFAGAEQCEASAVILSDGADERDPMTEARQLHGEIQKGAAEIFGAADEVPENFPYGYDVHRQGPENLILSHGWTKMDTDNCFVSDLRPSAFICG
jgi:hypothetical protein